MLDPSYLEGLHGLPLAEIRTRRNACNEEEVSLSYVRRVIQGRLDILQAERARRRAGQSGDLTSLVEQLPNILSEKVHAPGFGRLPTIMAPGDLGAEVTAEVDAAAPPAKFSRLPAVGDDELDGMIDALSALESRVSAQRKQLHVVQDRFQDELVQRYQSGEASVDGLLG